MRVALIAAVADNGVIGRGNELPWRLPADLKRFKRLTMGHHLIIGRKTWEAIGGPLPGRRMLVLSRSQSLSAPGARVCSSLDEALAVAAEAADEEPFIGGGAEIYRQALARADRLYLTRVHAEPEGDAVFPELEPGRWRLVSREERRPDGRNPHRLTFLVYDREPVSSPASAARSSSRLT